MPSVSRRLGVIITLALATAYAGCGGSQQFGQTAFPQLPLNPQSGPLLYVGNRNTNAVDIFPLTGPNQKQVGSITKGMHGPWGLSVDANNSLYVADVGNGTVKVYPYGSSAPSMTYSQGVRDPLYAVADSGHVFVSGRDPGSRNRGYVYEYNVGTSTPIKRSLLGSEADGLAEDAHGNLYVAYRRTGVNCSIAQFAPGLRKKKTLGMTINQPQGLLVDSGGNIVVVESVLDDVKVFPPGASQPSVTVKIPVSYNLAELAMQNSETTLWVSAENGEVYSMPYPLTSSTVPTEYESDSLSNGIAVTP